ncbi:MAG: tRNA dihydrouridine synthase DusB [Candidatus Aureabacteria bacterium]|nr:tRNA dihydrouridine synthase DusB [Candidatus Auribacterota bacterium]
MLNIGGTKIKTHILLAPLAGVSNLPFRLIARKHGCAFAFTEMISARALYYKNKNTLKMLESNKDDKPLGVQILGDEPKVLKKAVETLNRFKFDILDFNAACPAGKVSSRNKGAALLKNPDKLLAQISTVTEISKVPVTLKIRSGWDEENINAVKIAEIAEKAGIKALFLHGRTKIQGYSGNVNYKIIKEVKQSVKIPVIASGDNFNPVLIKKMFDETQCNAVTVARGALGNPWIFEAAEEFIKTGILPEKPTINKITAVMKEHLLLLTDFYGSLKSVPEFRKFFTWYTKGIKNIKGLREKAFKAKTLQEMLGVIEELKLTAD